MEYQPKSLSKILMSIPIIQMLTLMMSHQGIMLVSTALGQRRLPICLSSHVFPLYQLKKDDWRRTATFHMFTNFGDKRCKVIVDSGNCINKYRPGCMKILD